jgi:SAM-dependent methyltransferase
MFTQLQNINQRPEVFSVYTAEELWTDEHTAKEMLKYHLDEGLPLASRTHETIESSVAWMQSYFAIGDQTAIADFGCGPGLYANRLAQLGAQVTGIDFSENSIAYAQGVAEQQGLSIDYRHQNYLDFKSEQKFDLICMIFCDFCALSPLQRQKLLQVFQRHLKKDGALFLDVWSLAAYEKREEQAGYELNQLNGFWAAEDYYGFLNTFKYDLEKVVLDKYSMFTKSRSWTVYNWLQYYSLEKLTREFSENGFTINETFGDVTGKTYSGDSEEIALIARKKE